MMGSGYLLMKCVWAADKHDGGEDRNASMLVYPDGYYCMASSCGTSGPLHKLYAELNSPGTTRAGAADHPSGYPPRLPASPYDMAEFVDTAHRTILRNNSFSWYAEQRGIKGRIEPCDLGWHEGWLVIPVYSEKRELNGLIIRSGPQQQRTTGLRFSQPTGQRAMIYCPDWRLLSTAKSLFVVYGMIDALTLSELRLPVVTTTGGAKSFDPRWLNSIRKPIYIVPDKGEVAVATTLTGQLDWRGRMKTLKYPGEFKDPADYIAAGRGDELRAELVGA